ncbi:hypothetical protein GCM10027098_01070 [Bowmanella dokdonensis]
MSWGNYQALNEGKDKLVKVSPATQDAYWYYYTPEGTKEVYDQSGRLRKIYNTQGHMQVLNYEEGLLISILDPRGRTLTLNYDDSNRLESLTQPDGYKVTYSYDNVGNLVKVTFPDSDSDPSNNPSIRYIYDDPSHPLALTSKVDAAGNRIASWVYDNEGRVIESRHINDNEPTYFEYQEGVTVVTQDNGYEKTLNYVDGRLMSTVGATCATDGTQGVVNYGYHAYGHLNLKTDADGTKTSYSPTVRGLPGTVYEGYVSSYNYKRMTTYSWHPDFSMPTQIKEANLKTKDFSYDELGRLTSIKVTANGAVRETLYSYNSQGLLSSVDGPRVDLSDVTNFTYYPNGDLKSITNALGQILTVNSYDANGRATEITDHNGLVLSFTYDPRGRLLAMTEGSLATTFTYDNNGSLVGTYDGNQSLEFHYDNDNRLTAIEDEDGNKLVYTLDSYGNTTETQVIGQQQELLYSLTQTFDSLNRLTKSISAGSHETSYEYDIVSNLVKTIDPLMHTTEQVMDGVHRVTKVLDALQGEQFFTYDHLDNLTSVKNQNDQTTSYLYNGFGEVIKLTSPDTGVTDYTYDLAGNLLTKTDARGITATYQYDALNRLTAVSYPDSSENITLGYDAPTAGRNGIGRLTSASANGIDYQYYYDSNGQITKVETQVTYRGTLSSSQTEYQYSNGLLTDITYPSGAMVGYTYAQGKVTTVTLTTLDNEGQPVVSTLADRIAFLPFGPLTELTYGNGKVLTQQYSLDYKLVSKNISGVVEKSYTLNEVGNITDIADTITPTRNQSLTYDAVSRLTDATGNYGDLEFSYDAIGNRLSKTLDNVTETYQYNGNHLLSVGSTALTYDAAGNLITREADSFSYNDANRLEQAMVSTGTDNYRYDHQGQRVINDNNGQVRLYHYDQSGLLLAETDQSGDTLVEYIYLNGQRLAMRIDDQLYYVHTNHLDAPLALTDASGNTVWQATYSPFGRIQIELDLLTKEVKPRFPGQYADIETGFYYNYFRDYDPEIGRYIQSDPLGLYDGPNTYVYVYNNPVNYIDPTGKWGIAGGIYGAVSGGIGGYISGGWRGAIVGAGAGALVGAVNPFGASSAGAAAGAGIASLLGQSAGNLVSGKDITNSCNYDFSAAAGAALGGALGGPLGNVAGRYIRPYRYPIVGRPINSAGISKMPGNTVGSAVEGISVGIGELGGQQP